MPTQSYVFGTKANSFAQVAAVLKSIPVSGARAIRQSRQDAIARVSALLKNTLVGQKPEQTGDGEEKYRCAPISMEIAKQVPQDLAFVRKFNNINFMDDYWLQEAGKFLGYETRIVWENRAPYLYLKEIVKAAPVQRPLQLIDLEDETEIPF
jgi:hypothetical protein